MNTVTVTVPAARLPSSTFLNSTDAWPSVLPTTTLTQVEPRNAYPATPIVSNVWVLSPPTATRVRLTPFISTLKGFAPTHVPLASFPPSRNVWVMSFIHIECGSNCDECLNLNRCSKCEEGFSLSEGICSETCPPSFYAADGVC